MKHCNPMKQRSNHLFAQVSNIMSTVSEGAVLGAQVISAPACFLGFCSFAHHYKVRITNEQYASSGGPLMVASKFPHSRVAGVEAGP